MKHAFLMVPFALACGLLAPGCKSTPGHTGGSQTSTRVSKGAHSIPELIDTVAAAPDSFEFVLDRKMMVQKGPEMAERLRQRYESAGSPEMKTDHWVDRYATSADGNSGIYYVRQVNGSRVPLAPWLKARIAH